jgi:hypothetical protein
MITISIPKEHFEKQMARYPEREAYAKKSLIDYMYNRQEISYSGMLYRVLRFSDINGYYYSFYTILDNCLIELTTTIAELFKQDVLLFGVKTSYTIKWYSQILSRLKSSNL